MTKIFTAVALVLTFGVTSINAAPSSPKYTPEQKAEILKVAEISGFSFGATKAVLEACPTPASQISRYDSAIKKYKDKLGEYSFGVEAQKSYESSFNKSRTDMTTKLISADKTALCKEVSSSMEQLLQKLEEAVKEGSSAAEPKQVAPKQESAKLPKK